MKVISKSDSTLYMQRGEYHRNQCLWASCGLFFAI